MGDPVEIRHNDDGSIDEVIVNDGTVSIEQMADDVWSMIVTSGEREWYFAFTRAGKTVLLKCVESDA